VSDSAGQLRADPSDRQAAEHRALVLSMVGAGAFAALGIVLGIATGSQVILFDGVFSLLGVLLAGMALGAAKVAGRQPTSSFPFGRESFAPLVIGVEGVALLATCVYAGIGAVATIASGGGEVAGGWSIAYAVVAFVVPLGVAGWLDRTSDSELVAAEATQWRAAGIFGLGMLLAFVVAGVLTRAGFTAAAAYIDPALVLVAAVVFTLPPLRMLRTMARELLEAAPDAELQAQVRVAIDQVVQQHGLDEHHLRTAKVGPKLYVEVDFLVDPEWRVAQSDVVRHSVLAALRDLPFEPWLTVEFTADPSWGE
jgi:cation diffusion facilitator family transporter